MRYSTNSIVGGFDHLILFSTVEDALMSCGEMQEQSCGRVSTGWATTRNKKLRCASVIASVLNEVFGGVKCLDVEIIWAGRELKVLG